MKKKRLCLIFSICLLLAFTACKQSDNTDGENAQSSTDSSVESSIPEETVEPESSIETPIEQESSDTDVTPDKYFVTGKYDFEYVKMHR